MHQYKRVYDDILQKIKGGMLKDGDLIPKEIDLSAEFGVSRPTVRHALADLVNEGYLRRVKGNGSYVTKPKLLQEYTKFIESYNDEMDKKGLLPKTDLLEVSLAAASPTVCENLNLNKDEKVIKLLRLRSVVLEDGNTKPLILTAVYFKANLLPDAFKHDFERESFYTVLAENGINVSKATRILEIKPLGSKNASFFNLPESSPCHFISSIGYDEAGRAVEYSENFYPADRNKFIIEINR